MKFAANARNSRRGRIALVAAAAIAAFSVSVPFLASANATSKGEGYNTSAECQGKFEDKATKLVAFKSFEFYVNGNKTSTEYREVSQYLSEGAKVTIKFELKPECDNTYVGISTWQLPSSGFKPEEASSQKLASRTGKAFSAGEVHELSATLPNCWFQMDVNTGWEYQPGDYTLDKMGRLLLAGTGGNTGVCATTTTPAPTTTVAPTTVVPQETTTTRPAPTTTTSTTSTTVKPTTTTQKPTTTVKPTTTTTAPPVTPTEHKPSVSVEQVCSTDSSGFTTTFTNSGNVKESIAVKMGDKTLDTVVVEVGKSVNKNYRFDDLNIAPGKSGTITFSADNKTISTQKVTNDCVRVSADVSAVCDTIVGSGAVFTFSNTGKVAEVFNITRDGVAVTGSPVTVPAGETNSQKLLTMNEDESAKLVITGQNSGLKVEKNVKLDCLQVAPTSVTTAPPQVLGEQIVRPQLAATGYDPKPWLAVAILLTGVGFGLIHTSRRLRIAD